MKVLMLSLDRGLCNKESMVYRRMLSYAREVEIRVVVFTTGEREAEIHDGNLHIYPTNTKNRALFPLDFWRLARPFLSQTEPRFIITAQDPFEVGLIGYLLAWYYNCPLQLQVHIDFFSPYFKNESWRQWLQAVIARFLLPKTDAIRVVSARIYDYVTDILKVPSERVFELPVFTDTSHYLDSSVKIDLHEKYPQYKQIILLAARFVPQKNIDLAIKSFVEVQKNFPRAGLLIVGRGREEGRLKKLAAGLPGISFEAWADDLASYYKTADIFLLSSNYEGWGLTVVEAAASGAPIIMTEVGCAGEFLIPGSGLVVPVNNKEKMASAILELLSNPVLGRALGARAQELARGLPDLETNTREMISGWQKVSLAKRSRLFSPEVYKFLVTGVTSSTSALVTIFLMVDGLGLRPVPGSMIANLVSGAVGFLLNKHWTFSNRSREWHRQALAYGGLVMINLLLSGLFMHFLNGYLKIWYFLAQVLIILGLVTFNFLVNKLFIFRHHKS